MAHIKFDINPALIKQLFPAIREIKDLEAMKIFAKKYIDSGLVVSEFSIKENFIKWCNEQNGDKLEIGPFDMPAIKGEHVEYFDILDQEELQERAKHHNRKPERVPHIHHVNCSGDLGSIEKKYDIVFSAHCVEHAANLVKHFEQVGNLLKPNGAYCLIIPDKRYCFDHRLPESSIADVLNAYHNNHAKPGLDKVIEHKALRTHNNSIRHWTGDHGPSSDQASEQASEQVLVANALEEYLSTKKYIDVHCWQFTPLSLFKILSTLDSLGLFPFKKAKIGLTAFGKKDFTAIFSR